MNLIFLIFAVLTAIFHIQYKNNFSFVLFIIGISSFIFVMEYDTNNLLKFTHSMLILICGSYYMGLTIMYRNNSFLSMSWEGIPQNIQLKLKISLFSVWILSFIYIIIYEI